MILTARFYGFLALGAVLALVFSLLTSLAAAFGLMLIYDLTLLGIAWVDSRRTRDRRVTVTRHLEPRLSIGRDNAISLEVRHPKPRAPRKAKTATRSTTVIQIQDHHPTDHLTVTGLPILAQLPPPSLHQTSRILQSQTEPPSRSQLQSQAQSQSPSQSSSGSFGLTYHVHPTRRGVRRWGAIQVRQRSPWGLVWHSWRLEQPAETQVYPDLVGLRELSIRLAVQAAGNLQQRRRWGMGTEFAELRDYGAGDDLRLLDWKATARRGQPLVRVLEPEQEQTLVILLDRGRLMTAQIQGMQRFDWAINAALALAVAGLHRGDRVGLGVFDREVHTWIPPQRGQAHLSQLIEAVTPLEPVLEEPDYMGAVTTVLRQQTRRALVVILTDLVDAIASADLLAALARLSPRYLPFGVALRDPLLDQQAQGVAIGSRSAPDSRATAPFNPGHPAATNPVTAAYQQAVALDLLAQRQVAFAQVKRQGALVLDAPAPQVGTELVDAYLRLKARNRL
ncbi:MAG: DUF58 domain-containing protein [Prochlorothrix sp.]|nr:DUF58 domain-containing protein [Prochlorothrix sp.]